MLLWKQSENNIEIELTDWVVLMSFELSLLELGFICYINGLHGVMFQKMILFKVILVWLVCVKYAQYMQFFSFIHYYK
jgi:hypothetical protein